MPKRYDKFGFKTVGIADASAFFQRSGLSRVSVLLDVRALDDMDGIAGRLTRAEPVLLQTELIEESPDEDDE